MGENVCAFHKDMEEQLKDHETRIRCLEKSNLEILGRLESLCEKVSELVEIIKSLGQSMKKAAYIAVTVGVGFIIWYIQSLPR